MDFKLYAVYIFVNLYVIHMSNTTICLCTITHRRANGIGNKFEVDCNLCSSKSLYWSCVFQDKRFHNWLENARDWAISRSRFWGTPLPLWISEDEKEIVVIDSVAKLEKLSGVKVRHFFENT